MARYGQQLLRRLTFQFCDLMGSSRGMRWVGCAVVVLLEWL
jgi:hypothetical protein